MDLSPPPQTIVVHQQTDVSSEPTRTANVAALDQSMDDLKKLMLESKTILPWAEKQLQENSDIRGQDLANQEKLRKLLLELATKVDKFNAPKPFDPVELQQKIDTQQQAIFTLQQKNIDFAVQLAATQTQLQNIVKIQETISSTLNLHNQTLTRAAPTTGFFTGKFCAAAGTITALLTFLWYYTHKM